MDDQWIKGTGLAGIRHVHSHGTKHQSDRRMPMLVDPNVTPRVWRATYVCRDCSAITVREWVEDRLGQ